MDGPSDVRDMVMNLRRTAAEPATQSATDLPAAAEIDGTVCPPEFNPFDIAADEPDPASSPGLAPALRAELMEQIGYRPMRWGDQPARRDRVTAVVDHAH